MRVMLLARSNDLCAFCPSANDCGKLHIPHNGSLLGNKTTFPNFVTFSCDEGFILKGSKIRHCQANKTWTGEHTYCDGKQVEHLSLDQLCLKSHDIVIFKLAINCYQLFFTANLWTKLQLCFYSVILDAITYDNEKTIFKSVLNLDLITFYLCLCSC